MARRAHPPLRPGTLAATLALGLAALAPGACGLNRIGLEGAFDAHFEIIQVDALGGHSGAAGVAGRGGAGDGTAGGGGGSSAGGNGGVGSGGSGGAGTGGIGTGGSGTGGIGTGGTGTGGVGTGGITVGTGGQGVGGMPGLGGAGGVVTTGCSAANCLNGCCTSDGACITTLTPQVCGHAGARCQVCAVCERCSGAGACEVDPASHWDLSAVSAMVAGTNAMSQPPNAPWDLASDEVGGTAPDPFCELDVFSPPPTTLVIGRTATIIDTTTPTWGVLTPASAALLNPAAAPIRASDYMAGGLAWVIVVGDDDVGVPGATAGEILCQINGPLTPADFHAGNFSRSGIDACQSVSFKLTCHP